MQDVPVELPTGSVEISSLTPPARVYCCRLVFRHVGLDVKTNVTEH